MGSHYGVRTRKKETAVKKQQKGKHECPRCHKKKLKNKSYAKWVCGSCGTEIAGGAYQPETEVGAAARKALSTLSG